ncbi:hypothetical protein, partial [Acinetobacter baumannii]|uniref:hypothetical protein n=1 Tax=Acinetobacter baumannii TaxID=470 RepID=UPI001BC8821E
PKLRLKFGSIRGALHFKSLCNKALFNSNKNCLINKLATLYLLSLSLYLIDFLIFLKTEL